MANDPVRVSSSSLIRVGGTNFSSMTGVGDLKAQIMAAASVSPIHSLTTKAMGIVEDVNIPELAVYKKPTLKGPTTPQFRRGLEFRDKKTGKRVTILQANAGVTKTTKTPVHKVIDNSGNEWRAKETDLKPIR